VGAEISYTAGVEVFLGKIGGGAAAENIIRHVLILQFILYAPGGNFYHYTE
jgi:hypothetical protein